MHLFEVMINQDVERVTTLVNFIEQVTTVVNVIRSGGGERKNGVKGPTVTGEVTDRIGDSMM